MTASLLAAWVVAGALTLPVPAQQLFRDPARPILPSTLMGTRGAVLADVDGDRDLDVLFHADGGPSVLGTGKERLWINDGRGNFTERPIPSTDTNSPDLQAGDVDGDLDIDYVVSDGLSGMRLYVNDGQGHFTDVSTRIPALPGRPSVGKLVLIDVDADRDLDLVAAISGEPAVVYANDGRGVFTIRSRPGQAGWFVSEIAAADLDKDLDIDLALRTSQGLQVWANDGLGTFTDVTATRIGRVIFTSAVTVADLNHDQANDLITTEYVLVNDGQGRFTAAAQARSPNVERLRTADVDQDGNVDLLCLEAGVVWLFRGDGRAGFTERADLLPAMLGPDYFRPGISDLAIGDLDGDGDPDLVIAVNTLQGRVQVVFNTGAGRFRSPDVVPIGPAGISGAAVADFDGDGALDVALSRTLVPAWLRNDGFGHLTDVREVPLVGPAYGVHAVLAHDFDGDGDGDWFCLENLNGGILLQNDGHAHFTELPLVGLPAPSLWHSCVAVDLDGDRDLDLVLTGRTPFAFSDLLGLRNDGTGRFAVIPGPVIKQANWVAAGDIDLDGDQDLVVSRYGGDLLLVNDGTGRFTDASWQMPALASRTGVLLDVDRDGDLDLLRSWGPPTLSLNDGRGHFTDASSNLGVLSPYLIPTAVVGIDVDRDGDLDLVFGHQTSEPDSVPRLTLLENDGNGRFRDRSALLPRDTIGCTVLLAADFDRDGDVDLFAGAFGQSRLLQNLDRQVFAPAPPRLGEAYSIRIHTPPGVPGPRIAVPILAQARALTPAPPFGIFGLDLTQHAVLPALLLLGPVGGVELQIPSDPSLRGQPLFVQAGILLPSATGMLTNVFADVLQ